MQLHFSGAVCDTTFYVKVSYITGGDEMPLLSLWGGVDRRRCHVNG
jgi:hypothetical protein